MKLLLTLLTLLIFTLSWGQEIKKKTYENESPPYKETYYVLKDNQEIKHGGYIKSYKNLSAKGQFDNGKRVGVWEFTGYDGQIEQKIDFTNNKVTSFNKSNLFEEYWIKEGDSYKRIEPDEPPVFVGGRGWYNYYLSRLLRYPSDAQRNNAQGTVYISVTITKDGLMIEEKIEEGPGFGLNEEALRVLQQIPDDWIPARINGETVDIRTVIPIKFKLN